MDDPKVAHLSVTHPLVRQAAIHWEARERVYVSVSSGSTAAPAGDHFFAVYRWRKRGVTDDEELGGDTMLNCVLSSYISPSLIFSGFRQFSQFNPAAAGSWLLSPTLPSSGMG